MSLDPGAALTGADLYAWLQWEQDLIGGRRSPNTLVSYGSALAQLSQQLPAIEAAEAARSGREPAPVTVLTAAREHLRGYLIWLAETRSDATALNRWRTLRAFYNWAVREDIVARSPMLKVPKPSGAQRDPTVLSREEIAALIGACSPARGRPGFRDRRDAAMLALFVSPGSPRLSEMAALTIDDIDIRSGDVLIREGKGRKERTIPMPPSALRLMLAYLRERESHPKSGLTRDLWLGDRNRQNLGGHAIAQMVESRSVAAGKKVHPHELRHTAFHWYQMLGGQVDDARVLFGWSDLQMVLVYGRTAAAHRARDKGRMIDVLGEIPATRRRAQ